jgi:signal peptidase I
LVSKEDHELTSAVRTVRRLLDLVLIVLVFAVLAIVLAATAGPSLGHQLMIVRTGSMTPAIPAGTMIDVTHVNAADLKVGDVVSLTAPNGVIDTHRVNRVVSLPDGLYIETKGDANAAPDPVLAPASAVVGRVDFSVPVAGYLMYMLTIPTGIVAVFCIAFTLLLAIWFLEDVEGKNDDDDQPYEYESELARVLDAQRKSGSA